MNSTRPAYSLIFAFLIMTVMLIVAGTAIQNTNDKLALYNELGGSSQAELAAESAAEQGIYAIADTDGDGVLDYSPGFEAQDDEAFCEDTDGDNSCNSWGDFIALAEQKSDGTYFYTPIFGTGTAGNSEECSILDYIDPSDGSLLTGLPSDFVDDPCNWNKLMAGETVTIPLFDTDSSGNIKTPATLSGFTGWSLKVRTPCSDESFTSTCARYEMDENNSDPDGPVEGDSVIFWQLLGEDSSGNEAILIPNDKAEDVPISRTEVELQRTNDTNSEIYEALINSAADYSVLSVSSSSDATSVYHTIYNYCIGDTDNDSVAETTFTSLYLQLAIVTPLLNSDGAPIPYLEWQLETASIEPMSDNKSVFIGQGYFRGLGNTYYASSVLTRSTTGESSNVYTLSN